MTFVDPNFEVCGDKLLFEDRHLLVKVKNPVFGVHDSYRVTFQPKLIGYHDTEAKGSVLVFPLIPQYFHNFFEIFTKVLILKTLKESFKVVLVHPENKINGVFPSLLREYEEASCNASHLKDFLDFVGVEFLCLNPFELVSSRFRHVYLSYLDKSYKNSDSTQEYENKSFELFHFLKVPFSETLVKDVRLLRELFPHTCYEKKDRIFISRKKAWDRKYSHQDSLESMMNRLGYRSVLLEDMPLLEQFQTVQSASHIVCEYGSALVNCSLVGEGTKIFSINHTEGYYVDPYHAIFKAYNINHTGLSILDRSDPLKAISASLRASQDFYEV